MSVNRRYHVCYNLRKITSHSNLITKYVSFPTYPSYITRFVFTYLHRAARYFIDEYRVKLLRQNRHIKLFSFGIRKVDQSFHAKLNAIFRFDVNLYSMNKI